MSAFISILIWAVIIWIIVLRIIKRTGNGAGGKKTPSAGNKARKYTNYKPHKDIVSVSRDMSDKRGATLRDDRENDWLAQQLREEHKAFKATSEMFDLKIEHASHCDSRLLEQYHRRNCTATGVDLANGSSTSRRTVQNR